MPAFEVIAKGFDGGTDQTDDRILWVWSETEQWLRDSLKGAYHAGMNSLDADRLGLSPHNYDFIMPKDVQALHDRLRALAGIPRLNQMVRGNDYMHDMHGRVTFVASDPHDGAYLICTYWDKETDDAAYFGCVSEVLRFLPPEENQKP